MGLKKDLVRVDRRLTELAGTISRHIGVDVEFDGLTWQVQEEVWDGEVHGWIDWGFGHVELELAGAYEEGQGSLGGLWDAGADISVYCEQNDPESLRRRDGSFCTHSLGTWRRRLLTPKEAVRALYDLTWEIEAQFASLHPSRLTSPLHSEREE